MRRIIIGVVLCVVSCCTVGGVIVDSTKVDRPKIVERKIRTIYDRDGRPINQGEESKGWHKVAGSATLSGGRATLTLNSAPGEGRQDVSFLSSSTYRGSSWSLDTTNTNRYWIVPLSGKSFMVKSSDSTDNTTVHWKVEGE